VDIITGRLVVRITNTETGESKIYNISGPGQIIRDGAIETDVILGRALLFDPSFGMLVTSSGVVAAFNVANLHNNGPLTADDVKRLYLF
jgi:hypothetical protein